jgi:hypothetical protein
MPIGAVTVPASAPAGVTGAIFSVAVKQISSARMLGFRFHPKCVSHVLWQ